MVLLNELLEQAATLAVQLADDAGDATGAADAIAERIQALTDRLSTEGDEAHRHLQALAGKLAQAEAGRETAGAR